MNIKKDIIIEGIIDISKQKTYSKIETKQGSEDYRLEEIVVKALGDELQDGYGQRFAGSIRVTIELQPNSIVVNEGNTLNNKTEYIPVMMEAEE